MARKNSLGCGTVIIGLIALAMAAKYWYVLVAIGFAALAIWGIVKLTRSWSTPEMPDKNALINQQLQQNNSGLLGKTLDRNNANSKAGQVNAVIEKDLAKEKAAAEVTINIINRLKATLIDTEKRRILDNKETAIQKRVAQINAEIENLLAFEKIVTSAVVASEKAAVAKVAAKIGASEKKVQIIKRLFAVLDRVRTQLILDAEKAATRERVDQVNAEIERILATEKATISTTVAAEKSSVEVALKQKAEDIEQIDNLSDLVLAPIETQWILDSENLGRSERIAHEDAKIAQVLATEKTAAEVVAEQQAVEEEKRIVELGVQDIAVPATITDVPKKQNAKCAYCGTWGLHSILRITYYTIDFHCFACGKNFFIFNSDTNALTPTPTVTKPEITQMLKHYDFVLDNEVGPLKTGDQWFDEKTQKRRVRTDSPKAFEWLLPFMPLEVIKISKNLSVLERGPGFSHVIAKELRVLIRERKKDKEPYEDLLRSLYGVCTLIDFTRSFSFDIFVVNSIIANVDIRELFNIQIDYSKMGYCYNEALLKTDVKWLIEFFGEPDTHQSFDALWPKIRQNAISRYCWVRLTNENKTTRSLSPKNPQKNMYEWLKAQIERMGYYHSGVYNNSYYLEREKQLQEIATRQDRNHKEWLEQKAAREAQLAASPVTVKTTTSVKQRGYAIPAPPKPSHSFSLDMVSIEAKLAETVAVSAILKDIFSEDAPMSPQTAAPEPTTTEASIAGLDVESFSFMQVLASKHIWARDELEKLADHHSLMLDGTLDSINDASYDHFGGPFFEGDDPIEINTEFAKEIAA